jgi:hypothetical protein
MTAGYLSMPKPPPVAAAFHHMWNNSESGPRPFIAPRAIHPQLLLDRHSEICHAFLGFRAPGKSSSAI